MCSSLQWLGNQDAARKRKSGGIRPGAWSCACVYTAQNLARKFLSQTKWEKLKLCVKWFLGHAVQRNVANRKMFLEKRGFMVYCGVTGASVHAPIQSNTMYAQMVGRYIYNIRLLEHPHSPILRYKKLPQGHSSPPCCM